MTDPTSSQRQGKSSRAPGRLKTVVRVWGTVVAAIGVLCLPVGFGISPKRDLSLFSNLADLGGFVRMGLTAIVLGVLAVGLSYVVPGEMGD